MTVGQRLPDPLLAGYFQLCALPPAYHGRLVASLPGDATLTNWMKPADIPI